VYQYCNWHHAGDTKSVTDSVFLGGERNRSRGERLSEVVGFVEDASVVGFDSTNSETRLRTGRFNVSQNSNHDRRLEDSQSG